jgi:acylpyruvate hydrolase
MKIICIGRNYVQHAKELGNDVPSEPVFFLKPDTALLQKNSPFFIPDFSNEIHHEVEIVVKINRLGKNISEKFAHKYYDEIGLGIDFTARDIQHELKAKGLPWEKAKAFDGSAVLGKKFIPISDIDNVQNIGFSLQKNNEMVQNGNTNDMLFNFDQIISHVSKFFTLKIGDLIYTGTPSGVGTVAINDELKGFIGEAEIFKCKVK